MSGEISFPITLGELEQGETLGYGFDVGEVWDASDFDTEETRNKIEGELALFAAGYWDISYRNASARC